ncbi:MAG: cation transporter [Chloroherpetonaceae bacterium]|nr:cation transporter [Chloroherpetonaceae bacterium]
MCELDTHYANQLRAVRVVLLINLLMFAVEMAAGLWAESTGLIADSLDMLADAAVYGLTLYAIGKTAREKKTAAWAAAIAQFILALWLAYEVVRRFLGGSEPIGWAMMGVSALAFAANYACLLLLDAHKKGEAHLRAAWIFTKYDLLANVGVIVSGALVLWLHTNLPDLVIGSIIALLVFYGTIEIFDVVKEKKASIT